jgi:outer membrane protein assembly factor BamB
MKILNLLALSAAVFLLAACSGATETKTVYIENDCGTKACPVNPTCDVPDFPDVTCPFAEITEPPPCQVEEVIEQEDTAEPPEEVVEPEDTGETPVPKLEVKIAVDDAILSGIATIGAIVTGGKAVMGVEFYVDNVRMDTDFIPPFNTSVNTTDFKDGYHLLSVFTADQYGQTASDSKQITFDNTPPKLLSNIPAEGDKVFFEDGPLNLKLEVDDPTSIKNATFRANGLLVAQFFQPPFIAQVSYDQLFVTIDSLPKNIYVQFEVTDYLGQMSSASANVTVLKRLLWSYETLGEIWAPGVALPNGNIVFGNLNNKVIELTQEGSLVQETNTSGSVTVSMAVNPANGMVFYGALDGNVYARNPGGGQAWSMNLDSPPGGGLVYRNGTVYVTSYSGKVLALSEGSGGVQWQGQLPDYISSTPDVATDGTVYVGCQDHSLYAVSGGSIQWSVPTGDEVWSSPTLGPDQTIYFGSNDGWVYATKPDGSPKWVEEVKGQIWGKPLVGSDGNVYVASTSKYVTKLEAASGNQLWTTKTEGLSYSSPVEGEDGRIYVGTTAGKVFSLNPDNGQINWSYSVGDSIHGTPLLVGKKLFIGSTNRKFFAMWASVP